MRHWRPALRMARRDLLRHKGRAILTMFLVALPVLVGTVAAQVHHNTRWAGEQDARVTMGAADALVTITPFPRTRLVFDRGEYVGPRPRDFTTDDTGRRRPVRRDPSDVLLASLLPAGSRSTPAPQYHQARLASGGSSQVTFLDATDPMSRGLVALDSGRAPTAADEVAVPAPMADELGMLDKAGRLLPDARLALADGSSVHAVGILADSVDFGGGTAAELLAPPDSVLRGSRPPRDFLVDLPVITSAKLHGLVSSLADQGVAARPREAILDPGAWGAGASAPSPVDPQALAIGALAVLFGLIEVVLIVGSAFAVSARRQVRDLGLLAASGGAPADLRRVVLAQGIVLGVGASLLGAASGIGVFFAGIPVYEQVSRHTVWTREIDWLSVVCVAVLGSLTGLVAALLPAWSIGRLTPVAALSGRFPVRPGESAAHRPAFLLSGAGLLMLVVGGLWTARAYAPRPRVGYFSPSPLPVALGGLGLVLLIGGMVWSAPYVVRRVAAVGRLLPLSGRFAFRDAARHRFRTAAAAVSLAVTVAGAVFAGFVLDSVAAQSAADDHLPPHSLMSYFDDGTYRATDSDRVERILATMHHVLGPVTARVAYSVVRPRTQGSSLVRKFAGDGDGDVRVIDEATLRHLVGADDGAALAAFRSGGVVTRNPAGARDGTLDVALSSHPRQPANHWQLPAVVVPGRGQADPGDLSSTWISAKTATGLGLATTPYSAFVTTSRAVTRDDLARLSVYGIDAFSQDPDRAAMRWLVLGAVGAAGLLTALVVGIAVALASAESRSDIATMAAVGAGPRRRRGLGAMHGVFLGLVGALLGLVIGVPAGASLIQVDGLPGLHIPWLALAGTLLVVPLLAAGAGWVVTPRHLPLVRRTG